MASDREIVEGIVLKMHEFFGPLAFEYAVKARGITIKKQRVAAVQGGRKTIMELIAVYEQFLGKAATGVILRALKPLMEKKEIEDLLNSS